VIAQEWFPLTNVRGEEVVVEVRVGGSPRSDPFNRELIHGGFLKKRPGEEPLLMVFVNPHIKSFDRWPRHIAEDELYRILAHELTHAADIWSGKGSGAHALDSTREEFKRKHHNHPAEVKALMRDVVTGVESEVQEYLDMGMEPRQALHSALADSKWADIEPYLTPKTKKTILKGVYTHLQDIGVFP